MQQSRRMPASLPLAMGAILTAIVIVLQLLGQFIKLGPFSVSLVLIPIIVGAAMCGPKISAWLGLVFGVIVLMTDAAAFFAVSVPGTVITVLVKGVVCGLGAGLIYSLLSGKNKYLAVILAAIVCPVLNSGIFLLGCRVFFFETIAQWGVAAGFDSAFRYMIFGLVGGNFLFELILDIVLCPVIVRLINIKFKN